MPTGCECRREFMSVFVSFFLMFLYRILGQKCVSGWRWKTFNRKSGSVLDLLWCIWTFLLRGHFIHRKYVTWGHFWCSTAPQKHVRVNPQLFLWHHLIFVPVIRVLEDALLASVFYLSSLSSGSTSVSNVLMKWPLVVLYCQRSLEINYYRCNNGCSLCCFLV